MKTFLALAALLTLATAVFAGDPKLSPLQAPQPTQAPLKLSAPQPQYEAPLTLQSVPTPVYAAQPVYTRVTTPVTTLQPITTTTLQPVTTTTLQPVTTLQTTDVLTASQPVLASNALLVSAGCRSRLHLPQLRNRSSTRTSTRTVIKS